MVDSIWGAAKLFSNNQYIAYPNYDKEYIRPEEAYRIMFEESDTDMAVAQTVPLMGWFKEGFSPARANYSLAEAYPDRVVFCGGVDPLYLGPRRRTGRDAAAEGRNGRPSASSSISRN